MTAAAAPQGATLRALRDPAAVVDGKGGVLHANSAFRDLALDFAKDGRTLLVFQGAAAPQMRLALQCAAEGRFTESHAYVEKSGGIRGYRAIFLPQPDSCALLLFKESSHDLAYVDLTTGLPNRRAANARLEQEWFRKCRSSKTEFCLAVADLDHFKMVNDRYGHDVGDEILSLIALDVKSNLRRGDWCARWAGEEFLLFFHDVGIEGGVKGCERVRGHLSENPRVTSGNIRIPVTISVGLVSSKDYAAKDMRRMFLDADILLYEAKHSGRNRIRARHAGEQVFWESGEISAMLRTGGLRVRQHPVAKGPDREPAGLLCLPGISGRDNTAARRMLRSARAHGMLTEIESRLLAEISGMLGKADATELFLPLSAGSLRCYGQNNGLTAGLHALTAAGHRPVVLASARRFPAELPHEQADKLRADGVRFGLREVNLENFPTRLLTELRPSHVLVGRGINDSRQLAEYMGRTLAAAGTTLITPPQIAEQVRHVCADVLVVPETALA